jgi:hypothetical protein
MLFRQLDGSLPNSQECKRCAKDIGNQAAVGNSALGGREKNASQSPKARVESGLAASAGQVGPEWAFVSMP